MRLVQGRGYIKQCLTGKAKKVWSEQANAKKAANRIANGCREPFVEIDPYIKITVFRRATGESVVIECKEGERIDNYSVYCNGEYKGVHGISTVMKNIRKALPRFRRMED